MITVIVSKIPYDLSYLGIQEDLGGPLAAAPALPRTKDSASSNVPKGTSFFICQTLSECQDHRHQTFDSDIRRGEVGEAACCAARSREVRVSVR